MAETSARIASLLTDGGLSLALAESLTGGMLTSRFARVPGASQWLRGGIVAYASEVKFDLLGVRPGPVVSRQASLDLARGVVKLLGAQVALAVTGVGGPEPQDDQPPGVVWVATSVAGDAQATLLRLRGNPEQICEEACSEAVELLHRRLTSGGRSSAGGSGQ